MHSEDNILKVFSALSLSLYIYTVYAAIRHALHGAHYAEYYVPTCCLSQQCETSKHIAVLAMCTLYRPRHTCISRISSQRSLRSRKWYIPHECRQTSTVVMIFVDIRKRRHYQEIHSLKKYWIDKSARSKTSQFSKHSHISTASIGHDAHK